jgi:hypothetical protein
MMSIPLELTTKGRVYEAGGDVERGTGREK